MDAAACLPTYNERLNLEPMVHALGRVLDTARDSVIVIDDASPDGTGDVADSLATELPWVSVIHRAEREGLGPAYVAGFRRALEQGADRIVAMDCDFQHDPRDVRRLIEAAEDADLVIGSRHAHGGEFDAAFVRRALSRAGSIYARALLGGHVRDPAAGFRCFRRTTLEAIDLDAFRFTGYGFHIEATYRVLRAGLSVREVPIRFGQRRAGSSKLSGAIVSEAMWKVPALRALAATGRLDGAWSSSRTATDDDDGAFDRTEPV